VAEVQLHLNATTARAVALENTAGLQRGAPAHATGGPIRVPVGEPVLGRLLNAIGQPADRGPPLSSSVRRRPIHAPGCHFRPDGGGRIVLAQGAHDQVWAEAGEPWPPQRSLAAAAAHLPALAAARVEATRVGVRPMPRDERPIVGPIPGLDGFYVVVSHSGVTLGPLWGRIAAADHPPRATRSTCRASIPRCRGRSRPRRSGHW